jgi:hypothetical protein
MCRPGLTVATLLCFSLAACGGEDAPIGPAGPAADTSAASPGAYAPGTGNAAVDTGSWPDFGFTVDTTTAPPATRSFNPAGRWTWHDFPDDAATGAAAGCGLVGSNQGSGLSLIETFVGGDFSSLLHPDESGNIDMTLLVHADGWDGMSMLPSSVHLQLLFGDQEAPGVTDRFVVSSSTFPNRDPELPSQVFFPNTQVQPNGYFETLAADVPITFSLSSDFNATMVISSAIVRGRLSADPPGLRVDEGMVTGYFSDATVEQVVIGLQQLCNVPDPASYCNALNIVLNPSKPVSESAALLAQLLGGYDSQVSGFEAFPCSGSDCNAISICWLFRAEGTTVVGVR